MSYLQLSNTPVGPQKGQTHKYLIARKIEKIVNAEGRFNTDMILVDAAMVNDEYMTMVSHNRSLIMSELHKLYTSQGIADYSARLGDVLCLLDCIEVGSIILFLKAFLLISKVKVMHGSMCQFVKQMFSSLDSLQKNTQRAEEEMSVVKLMKSLNGDMSCLKC